MQTNTVRSLNCLFSILFLFLCLPLHAQETSVSSSYPKKSPISAEVGYQIHSLPMSGSQLIGPTLMVNLTKGSQMGTRYLLAPDNVEDKRLSVFWRTSFGRKTLHFIFEPQYSYLWRSRENGGGFSTTGLAGGVNIELGSQWLLGALVGLEQSGTPFPFGTFWNRPVYILFTQFDF